MKKILLVLLVLLVLFVLFVLVKNTSSFTSFEPYFYVINLEGEKGQERRDHIKKVFENAGLGYVFFKAYDKEKIDTSKYINKSPHKKLSKGEIALSMTHNELYKKLLQSNEKYMLIAEDDFTVRENFKKYLYKILETLPPDFDVVKIEYIKKFNDDGTYNNTDNPEVPYSDNEKITYKKNILYSGAAGYIVSREGAKKILSLNDPIWLPADGVFDPKWQEVKNIKLNTYYVNPLLAWQGNVKRTII